jgi:uracil-DNA glycosylase
MQETNIRLHESWKQRLAQEFEKDYFKQLREFTRSEYLSKPVYPKPGDLFRAFNETPFDSVRVVILGQDPYHGESQAMGLSFSVPRGVRIPPSLQNIYKELENDLGQSTKNRSGDLSDWARQGVLLLNSTLTVVKGNAGSHQGKGWEQFTDSVIETLSNEREHLVFILWGNYAKVKGAKIDRSKHLVIESAHPSPFSAYNGFFGSKPFSKTNEYLEANQIPPISW